MQTAPARWTIVYQRRIGEVNKNMSIKTFQNMVRFGLEICPNTDHFGEGLQACILGPEFTSLRSRLPPVPDVAAANTNSNV